MGRGAAAVVGELAAARPGRAACWPRAARAARRSRRRSWPALPVGLPKLLVSTMASGDVSPYVGAKDVCVMYSVVDVAGINRISRLVLGNAAAAMAGMVLARAQAEPGEPAAADGERPLVAASMFGVTTPAVETARARLAGLGYEVLVFHATGAGGRALEALAEARLLAGVLDLTTTELADDLVGGVLSAGPDRLTAAGAAGAAAGRRARRAGHGELRAARHGARAVRRPPALRAQPDRDADAHHRRRRWPSWAPGSAARQRRRPGRPRCSGRDRGVSALDADGQPFCDAGGRRGLPRRAAPASWPRPAGSCAGSTRTSTTRRSAWRDG